MCVEPRENGYSDQWVSVVMVVYIRGEGHTQEVKHGEELARRHDHVVTKPTCNDGVMHDGLVRLVLEVAVPA